MPTQSATWLPEPLDFSLCHSEGEEVELAYASFQNTILHAHLFYRGKPIELNIHLKDGKELCFWHLITEENCGYRDYRSLRAKYINWIAPVITNSTASHVETGDVKSKGRTRHYIWYRPTYLVVLEQTKVSWYLVSAYPTDRPKTQITISKQLARKKDASP